MDENGGDKNDDGMKKEKNESDRANCSKTVEKKEQKKLQ